MKSSIQQNNCPRLVLLLRPECFFGLKPVPVETLHNIKTHSRAKKISNPHEPY